MSESSLDSGYTELLPGAHKGPKKKLSAWWMIIIFVMMLDSLSYGLSIIVARDRLVDALGDQSFLFSGLAVSVKGVFAFMIQPTFGALSDM